MSHLFPDADNPNFRAAEQEALLAGHSVDAAAMYGHLVNNEQALNANDEAWLKQLRDGIQNGTTRAMADDIANRIRLLAAEEADHREKYGF